MSHNILDFMIKDKSLFLSKKQDSPITLYCRHEFLLDMQLREVNCVRCKSKIEPIDAMEYFIKNYDRYSRPLENVKKELEEKYNLLEKLKKEINNAKARLIKLNRKIDNEY